MLWNHQQRAIDVGVKNGFVGIFHSPGAGKGRTSFELLKKWDSPFPCLVLSVKEQLHVGAEEAAKWIPGLNVIDVGGKSQKIRIDGVKLASGLCVMNYESFRGIRAECRNRKFKTVILDEAWKVSSPNAKITQAVLLYLHSAEHRVILSPWPARRKLDDVYALIKFLDGGERLGHTFSAFRNRFMYPHPAGFGWLPRHNAEEEVGKLIGDICSVVRDEDVRPSLGVPAAVYESVFVDMDDAQKISYAEAIKNWSLDGYELGGGGERYLRLCQLTAGQKFDVFSKNNKTSYLVDWLKRLDERERVVVFTWFRPETEGVAETLARETSRSVVMAYGGMKDNMETTLAKWAKIPGSVLVCQGSKSAGWHATESRYCIFHSQPQTALQKYQAVRRLERPPQTRSVLVIDLLMRNTLEPRVRDALIQQRDFMDALRDYVGSLRETS